MFPFVHEMLNDEEQLLSHIEQAWADCACGFRTKTRWRRDEKPSLRSARLLSVHEVLEVHHQAYMGGKASALLWALRICLQENVPPPYWCADGILEKLVRLESEASSLHDLFDLKREGFKQGKRGLNMIARRRNALDIYVKVWTLKVAKPYITKEGALREVRKKYRMGISQGTARKLFDEKEAEQARLRKAHGVLFGGLRF